MTGDPRVIAALIQRAIEEQTGIQQYRIHRGIFAVQGYGRLVAYIDERIADEESHYAAIVNRLRELDSMPVGGIGDVQVSEDVRQIFGFDSNRESEAITNYRATIAICEEVGDYVTRDLVTGILKDENDHLRDIESNALQINQMTVQNYLSAQLGS